VDLTTLGEHGAACGGEVETPRIEGTPDKLAAGFLFLP
jgi:hypothetical protein